MPFHRSLLFDVDAPSLYDALREMLAPSLQDGTFEVVADREDEEFEIAYRNIVSSSRYHFGIQELEEGTRLEAQLWLGGLIGVPQSLLRFWSHKGHLDRLLRNVGDRAAEIAAADQAAESAADGEPEASD